MCFHSLFLSSGTPLSAPQYGGPFRASHRGSHQPTRRLRAHSPPSHGSTQNNKNLYSLNTDDTTVSPLRWSPNRAHHGYDNQTTLREGWLYRPPNQPLHTTYPRPDTYNIQSTSPQNTINEYPAQPWTSFQRQDQTRNYPKHTHQHIIHRNTPDKNYKPPRHPHLPEIWSPHQHNRLKLAQLWTPRDSWQAQTNKYLKTNVKT
jgi:hypothetical protein